MRKNRLLFILLAALFTAAALTEFVGLGLADRAGIAAERLPDILAKNKNPAAVRIPAPDLDFI